MSVFSDEFIAAIPKTDLHLHLDGSMRLSTLIELAKEQKLELPSFTEEGLNELIFKENYASLDEYLRGFGLTCGVMRELEAIERIGYELVQDNFAEGVRYIEIRFAPQLLMNRMLSYEAVMHAVDKGMRNARDEINRTIPPDEPEFDYGIIVCAMRFFNEHFSEYYHDFVRIHQYSAAKEIGMMASLELAKATVKLRNESDVQVVGFDLAGSEYGNPASVHKKSYDYIHQNFLKKTVHAGEAYGPESIFQAITKLHAERIGHGLNLFAENMITDKHITDKKAYMENLAGYIADRRITIEVCLTSNTQTVPGLTLQHHAFKHMLEHKLSVSICTDNRLVSHTNVSNEIKLAVDNFNISPRQLKNIIIYGFKRSFFYQPYNKRREYVRKVIDYYERLENQFVVDEG